MADSKRIAALLAQLRAKKFPMPMHGHSTCAADPDVVKWADIEAACAEPEPSAWQLIATAQKDRPVVLWARQWAEARVGSWFEPVANERGWWTANTMPVEPTHWMPLPDPPQVEPTYSREEFERDRFGETGDQYRESRSPDGDGQARQAGDAASSQGSSSRRDELLRDAPHADRSDAAGSEPADSHHPQVEAKAAAPLRYFRQAFRRALMQIAGSTEECGCDHTTEDCCNRVDVFCTRCIAAQALSYESEQFQKGPTERVEAAEQQIATLTAERDRLEEKNAALWKVNNEYAGMTLTERSAKETAEARLAALQVVVKRYLDQHCANADVEGMSNLCECKICRAVRTLFQGT